MLVSQQSKLHCCTAHLLILCAGVRLEPFDWGYTLALAGAPRAYMCVREKTVLGWRLPTFPGQWWRLLLPSTRKQHTSFALLAVMFPVCCIVCAITTAVDY
jgi:hypothetical protein